MSSVPNLGELEQGAMLGVRKAQRREVLTLVLKRGALVVGIGVASGVAAATMLTGYLQSMLSGLKALDVRRGGCGVRRYRHGGSVSARAARDGDQSAGGAAARIVLAVVRTATAPN